MTPLRGVVVGSGRVRLASGRIVTVPRVPGVRKYDAVAVLWDYIRNEPVSMAKWNPNAKSEELPDEPVPLHEVAEPAGEDEFLEYLDSGALDPLGVESGESGYWELVLSDGSLAAAGVE